MYWHPSDESKVTFWNRYRYCDCDCDRMPGFVRSIVLFDRYVSVGSPRNIRPRRTMPWLKNVHVRNVHFETGGYRYPYLVWCGDDFLLIRSSDVDQNGYRRLLARASEWHCRSCVQRVLCSRAEASVHYRMLLQRRQHAMRRANLPRSMTIVSQRPDGYVPGF